MIFFTAHLLPSRYQVQIDDERSFRLITQLTKPCALVGSCAGRSSNTSWCSSPKSISCRCLRLVKSQKCSSPAVFAAEQDLRNEPVLERVGRAPFAGDHGVVAEMPPGVVGELLRPAIDLPAAERLEALVIHHEHAARRLAVLVAERRDVDAARPAMDGVRAGVAGLLGDLLRLDGLDELGIARVGLGVEDVDARGAQARHHQIAPLHVRMRHLRTQARRAGVPAEMVELVAGIRHRHRADDLGIGRRLRIDVDDRDAVGLLPLGIERRHIGELFGRRLHRHARRRIEGRIGCPGRHVELPLVAWPLVRTRVVRLVTVDSPTAGRVQICPVAACGALRIA